MNKSEKKKKILKVNLFSHVSQRWLTVPTVSSGGLSLMSVMDMSAVAVLESPKFRLPSMSVAWTIMVYCDTFCEQKRRDRAQWSADPATNRQRSTKGEKQMSSTRRWSPKDKWTVNLRIQRDSQPGIARKIILPFVNQPLTGTVCRSIPHSKRRNKQRQTDTQSLREATMSWLTGPFVTVEKSRRSAAGADPGHHSL